MGFTRTIELPFHTESDTENADTESDAQAMAAARDVAAVLSSGAVPPRFALRLKAPAKPRSHRDLNLFFETLLLQNGGKLPPRIVVLVPRAAGPRVLADVSRLLADIEDRNQLAANSIEIELEGDA